MEKFSLSQKSAERPAGKNLKGAASPEIVSQKASAVTLRPGKDLIEKMAGRLASSAELQNVGAESQTANIDT